MASPTESLHVIELSDELLIFRRPYAAVASYQIFFLNLFFKIAGKFGHCINIPKQVHQLPKCASTVNLHMLYEVSLVTTAAESGK